MIFTLAGFVVWLPPIIGFGSALLLVGRKMRPSPDPSCIVFVGLAGIAILGIIANVLNFFVPVSPTIALILLAAGWLLFVLTARYWSFRAPSVAFTIFVVALLIYSAYSLQKPITHYDSGLYHFQSIKWITESKVPLGLANLHGRLGFNSLWSSIIAALEIPQLQEKGHFVANGILLLVYGLALGGVAFGLGSTKRVRLSSIFLILSAMVWVVTAKGQYVSSPYPDIAIPLLTLLSTYASIRTLESREGWLYHNLMGFLVAILAITIKLSAIPLLLAPAITLSWYLYGYRGQLDERRDTVRRSLVIALAAACLLLIPWITRGIVLSGCIAYPISVGCFSSALDWAVPMSQAEEESAAIRSWARAPGRPKPDFEAVLTSWDWFVPWVRDQLIPSFVARKVPSLLLSGLILLWIAARRKKAQLCRDWETYVLPGLAPFLGIIFWFFTAPGMKFAEGFFWSLGLLIFSAGVHRLYLADQPMKYNRILLLALLAIVLASSDGLRSIGYKELYVRRHEILFTWPTVPAADVEEHFTSKGARILVPTSGDQCWNADLPCSPYFSDGLEVTLSETGLPVKFQVAR